MNDLIFERLPVPAFRRWRRESSLVPARHWARVFTETDGARSLTLVLRPYRPYLPTSEGTELSAFYVASNALNRDHPGSLNLPLKPLIAGFGIGAYGRNGLTAVPGVGSHFAALVLPSENEPDPNRIWNEEPGFSDLCIRCGRCIRACPAGAIDGNARVDVTRCLRAQAQYQEPRMGDVFRPKLAGSLWGCEACRAVCPRESTTAVAMPPELENALRLDRLLSGDVAGLGEWIGTNYARPARMQARACLVAANLGRADLVPLIDRLRDHPLYAVRDCAEWALRRLGPGTSSEDCREAEE